MSKLVNYVQEEAVSKNDIAIRTATANTLETVSYTHLDVYKRQEAIRVARESGIRVAIASGRAWNEMNDVIEKLPCLRYFMCTNGAYVMDKDENRSLFHVNFDKEQALSLIHI